MGFKQRIIAIGKKTVFRAYSMYLKFTKSMTKKIPSKLVVWDIKSAEFYADPTFVEVVPK